jgi:hypothetical protein
MDIVIGQQKPTFSCPTGSDPGAFMLGRHGLYIRELDVWISFLLFKGTDIHSGSHPTYAPESMEAWTKEQEALNKMWESSVNRVALVSYPTASICNRVASMSTSPSLHFLNDSAPAAHKAQQLNFAQHSRGILGDDEAFHNRMARDGVYAFLNHLTHSGVHLEGGISGLMSKLWYPAADGSKVVLAPPPMDLDSNSAYISRMRGHWSWHVGLSSTYRIRMTKFAYATEQERQAQQNKSLGAFSALENSRSVPLSNCLDAVQEDLIITKVLRRHIKGRQVGACWPDFIYTQLN